MAIQLRRGGYERLDPSKLLPGEWAIVLSGDPESDDGKAAYICFATGDIRRVATTADVTSIVLTRVDDMKESILKELKDTKDLYYAVLDDLVLTLEVQNRECGVATVNARKQTELAREATAAAMGAAETVTAQLTESEKKIDAAVLRADEAAARADAAAGSSGGYQLIDDATAVAFVESLFEKEGEDEDV